MQFYEQESNSIQLRQVLRKVKPAPEENAIVNLARNGRSVPLEECVLYTTTYPCRMCANKIANVGIKQVVYLEPYPDQRAKFKFRPFRGAI